MIKLILVENKHIYNLFIFWTFRGDVTSPLDKPLPPPCHFVSPFGEPPPPLVGGDVLYGWSQMKKINVYISQSYQIVCVKNSYHQGRRNRVGQVGHGLPNISEFTKVNQAPKVFLKFFY